MSTDTATDSRILRIAVRTAWLIAALLLVAFAVFESAKYGAATITAAVVFVILPDLTMLIGASESPRPAHGQFSPRAVPFYNAMHRPWLPLAILVGYPFGPIHWPPLFTAGLAWLAHIAVDRAAGYGLRAADGFRRG
jgi:hypothetical protein